jgi:hypothetical protein
MGERDRSKITFHGLKLSANAIDTLCAVSPGAAVDSAVVTADVENVRAGRVHVGDLLAECLDGAGESEASGWREYVEAVADAAGVSLWLVDYRTGERMRYATLDELEASTAQAERDAGRGVIDVDGNPCYVEQA